MKPALRARRVDTLPTVLTETLAGLVVGALASGSATYFFTVRQHERLGRREAIRSAMAAVARQQARRTYVTRLEADGAEAVNETMAVNALLAWREAVEEARDALAALEPYDTQRELRAFYTKSSLDDGEDVAVQAVLRRLLKGG